MVVHHWTLQGRDITAGGGVAYQQSFSTSSPVSTGMGDRVRVRLPEAALYFWI